MKKISLYAVTFVIIMLFAVSSVYSEENESSPVVAILDFKAINTPAADALVVTEYLRKTLSDLEGIKLVERSFMEAIIKEQKLQLSGCTDNDCAVEVGKILNAKYVITGSYGRLEDYYYINLRLVKIEEGKLLRAAEERITEIKELPEAINRIAMAFFDIVMSETNSYGKLIIFSSPPNSDVYIDGIYVGKTKYVQDYGGYLALIMNEGARAVRVEKGKSYWEGTVNIEKDKEKLLTAILKSETTFNLAWINDRRNLSGKQKSWIKAAFDNDNYNKIPFFRYYAIKKSSLKGYKETNKKGSLAVIDLNPTGVTPEQAELMTNFIINDLSETNVYDLVERKNIANILTELGLQYSGCTDRKCAVEVGKLLNVTKIIVGSLTKAGNIYYIFLRCVDVENSEIEFVMMEQSRDLSSLRNSIKKLVNDITTIGSVGINYKPLVSETHELAAARVTDELKNILFKSNKLAESWLSLKSGYIESFVPIYGWKMMPQINRTAPKNKKGLIVTLSWTGLLANIFFISQGIENFQNDSMNKAIENVLIGQGIYGLLQITAISVINNDTSSLMDKQQEKIIEYENDNKISYLPFITYCLKF